LGFLKGPSGLNDLLAKVNEQVNLAVAQRDEDRATADGKALARIRRTSAKWQHELAPEISEVGAGALDPGPIAGVSLETYASVARALRSDASGNDPVQAHGVSAESWAVAVDGWNVRIASDGAIAARFASLYEAAAV